MNFAFCPKSRFILVCFWLLLLLFSGPALYGVVVEMGREGEVLQHQVETPNIQSGQASDPSWNPSTPSTTIPKTEVGETPTVLSTIPELISRFADLIGTWTATLASDSENLAPISDLLAASEPFVHSGTGSSEKTAVRDGTARLEVYLPTYNPATIEVRVINPDNTEELFSGNSLLTWMRMNDRDSAQVVFKGVSQPDSVVQVAADNWDANQQEYPFELKAGQRLILSISGNPLSSSYVRVVSNAF